MECSTDLEPSLAKSVGSGAYIVYGTALGGHVLCAALFKVKISISLLRHCSIQNIKSSAQNAWTNIGVTTSLVMTTVVGALIEGHEMSPQGFCMEPQQRIHVQQIYVSLGIACLFLGGKPSDLVPQRFLGFKCLVVGFSFTPLKGKPLLLGIR